jgi:hypothetical protein
LRRERLIAVDISQPFSTAHVIRSIEYLIVARPFPVDKEARHEHVPRYSEKGVYAASGH